MLEGYERLVDLTGPHAGCPAEWVNGLDGLRESVRSGNLAALSSTQGHFSAVARDGKTVRMARTIGYPLRYFVAKMFHGPMLIVADRIDTLFEWCQKQKIGWQFDPAYTRMVPAHYLTEIDQIGCPDPAPRYHRFFDPPVGQGSPDLAEAGTRYAQAAYDALKQWLSTVPADEPIALAFSGGIDSTSVLLLARHALAEMGSSANRLRAFTLDLGGGKDASQAESVVRELDMENQWEVIRAEPEAYDLEQAITVIEDYHPLDVECAAAALALLAGIRTRYPGLTYLLDGDGGDENLKSYPLEDSDLTISSVLRNPLLYHEGWGVDAMKHSLTYSGGLSRSYCRTFAPAQHAGFTAFSPYTVRPVIAEALSIPYETVLQNSVEKLYALKAEVVRAGVKAVTGIDIPAHPKRRFQDGAGGESYRQWRVSKAWCRQVFLKQWEERLRNAWDPEADRMSGNEVPPALATSR